MKDIYTNYFSITKIKTITTIVPKYSYQKDLILYESNSLKWTQKQRESFLKDYAYDPESQKYIVCLLGYLDGQVSFYDVERSPIFKLVVQTKCNEFIPKK